MRLARFQRLFATLNQCQRRHHTRQHLLMLDDRLLKDIGLSRADAEREYGKPFWKA